VNKADSSQVLNGIIYLESEGLVHGRIARSNIVLTKKGVAKISMFLFVQSAPAANKCCLANVHYCLRSDVNSRRSDIRALGELMQELMEVRTEGGRLGLRDPSRWSKDAIEFLTLTMTETAEQLAKVCDIQIAIRKQDANYGTASIPERAKHCDTCSADFASNGLRLSIL
jgi:hypothetical protein